MRIEELAMIEQAVERNLRELISAGGLKAGKLIVVGTSTSEVIGRHIGTAGTLDVAKSIFQGAATVAQEHGVYLAFQCCEHLNRALVVEGALLERYALEPVWAIPVPKAGGSMAAYAYTQFREPVLVEAVQAHAGLDIGDTLIGMHLRRVAVPCRPPVRTIGQAHVTMAYTRPKLIGGARAVYTPEAAEAAKVSQAQQDC